MVFIFDKERKILCTGKTIVLTGGSGTGIGFETAKELVRRGGHVYILCRSQDRMDNSIKLIEQEKLNGSIHGIICDLKSLESVRTAAAEVLSKVEKIDICLLNAGIMRVPLELIRGIESQQFVNHFSHFLLLNLLYPKIESLKGRVVAVSSEAYKQGKNDCAYWKQSNSADEYYKAKLENPTTSWNPYGNSKLANMYHMRAMAHFKPSMRSFSVHPGVVVTELANTWMESSCLFRCSIPITKHFMKSAFEGAQTSIFCALSPTLEDEKYNGKYFSDGKLLTPSKPFGYTEENLQKAINLCTFSETITDSKIAK